MLLRDEQQLGLLLMRHDRQRDTLRSPIFGPPPGAELLDVSRAGLSLLPA